MYSGSIGSKLYYDKNSIIGKKYYSKTNTPEASGRKK